MEQIKRTGTHIRSTGFWQRHQANSTEKEEYFQNLFYICWILIWEERASTPTLFDTKIFIRWNIDNTQHKLRKPLDENTEVHLNNLDVRGFLRTKTHERNKRKKKECMKEKNIYSSNLEFLIKIHLFFLKKDTEKIFTIHAFDKGLISTIWRIHTRH